MPVPSPMFVVTARVTGRPLAVETDTLPLRVITTSERDVEAGRISEEITPMSEQEGVGGGPAMSRLLARVPQLTYTVPLPEYPQQPA